MLSGSVLIARIYVRFNGSLPTGDTALFGELSRGGLMFRSSDSSVYTYASTISNRGSSGIAVAADTYYRIDLLIDVTNNPWTVDGKVDGTNLGQATQASAGSTIATFFLGATAAVTADANMDDLMLSLTLGDYPLGAGYVNHFVPTADGAHNVAGANDFERSTTGTDIINSTTDAYQLVDDVPLKATSPTEFINMIAPPNATDYTEHIFGPAAGISTPTTGPRMVEVVALVAQNGTGLGNMEIRLNDNGSMGTVYTATAVAGIVAGKYVRAGFADPPSAASAWNAAGDGGNGDFLDLRVRFGSPSLLDVNPDQYFASIMIEAEFEEVTFDPATVFGQQMGAMQPSLTPVGVSPY